MTAQDLKKLRILKIYAFCQKIQQRTLVPGDSAAGFMYLHVRIHPKSYCIFSLQVATTLLSGSTKDAVRGY